MHLPENHRYLISRYFHGKSEKMIRGRNRPLFYGRVLIDYFNEGVLYVFRWFSFLSLCGNPLDEIMNLLAADLQRS